MRKAIIVLLFFSFIMGCSNDYMPKPTAYLSLEYPNKTYQKLALKRPYTFDVLKSATIVDAPKNWLKINYPQLKATIDITYRPVENNIKELLTEAEKLVFKHTVKADQILPKDYSNSDKKVHGSIYEITGNAASNLQFHITDSTNHFIKGVLYFYAKPNYDSVLPAVDYLKKDVLRLIETTEWK